jgi:sugar fermentation stimulation protein A
MIPDSGAYQLIIRLELPAVITVGALGELRFDAGSYIYTGRASKNLAKRIARHLSPEKKLRWHIDYLLQQAQIADVRVYAGKAKDECCINSETALRVRGIFPVKGFGSSDCRCFSHLMLIPDTCVNEHHGTSHAPCVTQRELRGR